MQTLISIQSIKSQISQYPDYLTSEQCGFNPATKALYAELFPVAASTGSGEEEDNIFAVPEGERFDVMITEIGYAYSIVKSMKPNSLADVKERADVMKITTNLLEKLLSLHEKAQSMKEISDFKKQVVTLLERVMTVDQREEFLDSLKGSSK